MSEQKFFAGDVVKVADDLGSTMRHFRAGGEAIVVGSYADQYGGTNHTSYTLLLMPEATECSWYYQGQLTLIRHGGQKALDDARAERDARDKVEGDLAWVVSHWSEIQDKIPPAAMTTLFNLMGITEPWGANGEGITWYTNARATVEYLRPALETGSVDEVLQRAAEAIQ